ncbi:MAG TPA: hypothetical protein VK509_07425 [Polyangiales bacterium]|nr:hypothetical protein [Polyangiales bacterium]
MTRGPIRGLIWFVLALGVLACEAPDRKPFAYYDERIAPVLEPGCARQTTGCHVDNGRGFALGNLDLSSYESLLKRRDVLAPYGPYSAGLLLLKAGDPIHVQVRTVDPPDPAQPERRYVTVETDIRHGGGEGAIAQGSPDYALLKQWIDGGYSKNGVPRLELTHSLGKCVSGAGELPGVDLDAALADPASYQAFATNVQPMLRQRCAGSSCHGSRTADLFLTCGDDGRDLRWNYEVALRHVSAQAASSELLRRPLALQAGGSYHEGGDVIADTDDPGYRALLNWAKDVAERVPELLRFEPEDDGLRFFANRVEPMLVRKGCMFLACHSPAMFHDLPLRGGSRGELSEIAIRRNYEMSKRLLALESPNPNAARLIAKNLCPPENGGQGIKHRGGALFEDFGGCGSAETQASPADCTAVDADAGKLDDTQAYCVLARWHAIERELAIERGELDAGDPRAVVWVARPEGGGGPLDFDSFAPGADLVIAGASQGADAQLNLAAPRSVLAGCGLSGSVDVRGPAVSWDGQRIAFAARSAASSPLRLYEMASDGSGCGPIDGIAAADEEAGILLHDFDPAYAPDGRLVFASTRGNLNGAGVRGPTRTPSALTPNANLYVRDDDGSVRQLTYLLDQEVNPSFMADGRLIFSVEKRAEGFHQISGRRQNLDGGDYHPLFAQRPSIGFDSATEIVELANRNLALVAAPLGASDGGGAIAVVNRSIGPDQADRDPGDRAYIHALTRPVPGALGGDVGVYRSPSPLPSGRLIASCDQDAADLNGAPHYGLCELDASGVSAPRSVYSDAARVALEPVAVYARAPLGVFQSRSDEVNGSTAIEAGADDAIVHYLDVPLLGTLLFSNTRTGRPIDQRIAGLQMFAAEPPPAGATSFEELGADVVEDGLGRYFQSLRSLGTAIAEADGSLRVRVPAGVPLTLGLIDADGDLLSFRDGGPFSGPMRQREAMQFYPGERAKQSLSRELFNGVCAGCHGSISGRELDVGIDVDVLTSASSTLASDDLRDLR